MATTKLTRTYWVDVLKGWAEDRLPGPQYDECCAVLDELMAGTISEDERLKRQFFQKPGIVEATPFCSICGESHDARDCKLPR